jgi:L-ascorbate metabolism protein UlaG (beta-lactamase superfamily)
MKVKKFPQSHLVLEKDGKKLVIDPGYITFEKGFKVSDFQGADVYLISHQHADHLGPETIKEVVGDKPILGNFDVVNKLKEVGVSQAKEIKNMEEAEIEGFKIKAVDLPHFKKEGFEMPHNTGFLIDGIFFHPGDGDKAPGITSENAAVPIAGASITYETALGFIEGIGAKTVIPIHYDWYKADAQEFKKMASSFGVDVRPLSHGEETEI